MNTDLIMCRYLRSVYLRVIPHDSALDVAECLNWSEVVLKIAIFVIVPIVFFSLIHEAESCHSTVTQSIVQDVRLVPVKLAIGHM